MLFRKLAVCFAALAIFSACGNGAETAQEPAQEVAQEAAFDEVILVLDWTPNTNHTGFFAAVERGYFAEENISVEIIQPPEDGAVMLVAAGHAQFGISFQEETILAANSPHAPLPVTGIAALVEHNTSGVLSLAEHNITRFRDLEGHTFGSWMIPLFDEMVKESIRLDGGDPDLVEFVPHMALDNITGIEREFDATWVFEGWDRIMAEQMGLNVNYFALRDVNPVFDYYTPLIITHENLVSDELTTRFLRATQRGFEFAIAEPVAAAAILHAHAPEMSQSFLIASQEFLSAAYAPSGNWGYIDAARWLAFFYWMRDNEFIPADAANPAFVNLQW
jgi:ABC-type nitrate/sulfonate/bicarbonate transport system substrate-binding protein